MSAACLVWLERWYDVTQTKTKKRKALEKSVRIPAPTPQSTRNDLLRSEIKKLHAVIRARIDSKLRDGHVIGCYVWKICVRHEGNLVTNVDDLIEWVITRLVWKVLGNRTDTVVPRKNTTAVMLNCMELFILSDILDWNVYKDFIPL
jgi:hypothetical protein